MMGSIATNLKQLQDRISRACNACGRDPTEITLLLATKTQPPERIREALQIEKHLIGHLQSNKAGKALDHVSCVQSIDRLSIAQKLNRLCEARERILDVCLQFNTSGENSKFGMAPAEALPFARAIAQLPNL